MKCHFDHLATETFIFLTFFFKCILTNRHLLCSDYLKVIRCWSFQCALKAIVQTDASYMHILTFSKVSLHKQMPAMRTTSKVFPHMLAMKGHFYHLVVKSIIKCIITNRLWQSWHHLKASSCTHRLYTHKCALKEITHADASYKHKPTCLKATPVHIFQLCAQPLKCSRTC
jgi:hypothetical protein